jgi:hypothetical protein
MELGWGFWLKSAIFVVVAGLALMILFFVFGVVWAAWGVLGTFAFVAAVLLLIGWIYDRREAKRRE